MDQLHSNSVVVGIDGSQAAVNAAKWAVEQAVSRQIPLRIVHVVGRSKAQSALAYTCDWEVESGETALHQAEMPCKASSDHPEQVLINKSPDAALVCVGTGRRGWAADKLLGALGSTFSRNSRPGRCRRHRIESSENRTSAIELAVVGGADADAQCFVVCD